MLRHLPLLSLTVLLVSCLEKPGTSTRGKKGDPKRSQQTRPLTSHQVSCVVTKSLSFRGNDDLTLTARPIAVSLNGGNNFPDMFKLDGAKAFEDLFGESLRQQLAADEKLKIELTAIKKYFQDTYPALQNKPFVEYDLALSSTGEFSYRVDFHHRVSLGGNELDNGATFAVSTTNLPEEFHQIGDSNPFQIKAGRDLGWAITGNLGLKITCK